MIFSNWKVFKNQIVSFVSFLFLSIFFHVWLRGTGRGEVCDPPPLPPLILSRSRPLMQATYPAKCVITRSHVFLVFLHYADINIQRNFSLWTFEPLVLRVAAKKVIF